MAKKGLTEIVCVIDKSGSMASLSNDTIGGFNRFLADQQKVVGDATMTITLFDTVYTKYVDGKPLNAVEPLTSQTYVPRGNTALLDAVGQTIDDVGKRLEAMPEHDRPEKVIFVIVTDGCENASRKYTRSQIFDMITHQTDAYKWEFLFMGANQDSFAEGAKLGVKRSHTSNFAATPDGIAGMCMDISSRTASMRTT